MEQILLETLLRPLENKEVTGDSMTQTGFVHFKAHLSLYYLQTPFLQDLILFFCLKNCFKDKDMKFLTSKQQAWN